MSLFVKVKKTNQKTYSIFSLKNTESMESKEKQLFQAINLKDITGVKKLLEEGVDINTKEDDGFAWTPLQHCIFKGALYPEDDRCIEIAKLLIENGADVQGLSATEAPPVLFAVKYFALDFLGLLLTNGGNLYACNSQNLNVFDVILDRYYRDQQLDEDHIDDEKDEGIKGAIKNGEDESLRRFFERIEAIVKHGYDLNAGEYSTAYCTILEINENKFPAKSLPFLFDKGANPQEAILQRDGNYAPLFFIACSKSLPLPILVDMAKRIGINYVFTQSSNFTPTLIATRCNNLDLLKNLVELGADIHTQNDRAIRVASAMGGREVVDFLLEHQLSITATDAKDRNAIDYAILNEFDELVAYLKLKC